MELKDPIIKVESEPSERTKKVLAIADKAASLLLEIRQSSFNVDFKKGDKFDPVTTADTSSDHFIRESLAREFLGDLVLSEENESIPEDFSGRVWMVDPLDGTRDFIKGNDGFSINIGLWENGELVLGVVNVPMRHKIYYAEKGMGAYTIVDGESKKIKVSDVKNISAARLITRNPGSDVRPLDELVNKIPARERIPESSIGIKISRIAEGEAEIHVNTNFRASKWDTAGPQIILEEAGGKITDIDGRELDYTQPRVLWERSFVASNNPTVHKEIIEIIRDS